MALVVFTGGARSGKSALAQESARVRALDGADVVVATFADTGHDEEMADRVARHRKDRSPDVRVIEAVDGDSWLSEVNQDDLLLVDCLGTLVTLVLNEVLREHDVPVDAPPLEEARVGPRAEPPLLPAGVAQDVEASVDALVTRLMTRPGDTIIVTNEVGYGVVPAYPSGRLFRDVLGRANRRLVSAADAAYLVVCGRAIELTTLPKTVRWPED